MCTGWFLNFLVASGRLLSREGEIRVITSCKKDGDIELSYDSKALRVNSRVVR